MENTNKIENNDVFDYCQDEYDEYGHKGDFCVCQYISIHETFFTRADGEPWAINILPSIYIDYGRILVGWLNFSIDFHIKSSIFD